MDNVFKDCTLHEALSILEDEEIEPEHIFIEPPEPSVLTDEDSADEDEPGLANNLSGRQLKARCEVKFTSKRRSPSSHGESTRDSECDVASSIPSTSTSFGRSRRARSSWGGRSRKPRGQGTRTRYRGQNTRDRVKRKISSDSESSSSSPSEQDDDVISASPMKNKQIWVSEDMTPKAVMFPEPDYAKYRGKSPVEMLELFLDTAFFEMILSETQKYAAFMNCPDPKITIDELVAFISILINSGYNTVPSKIHYWDQNDDMRNYMVYNCMRRDRFKTIMRFIHCADNTRLDASDKLWKLRPVINFLKRKFKENYVPSPNLNYDESMIEYFGKHGCKQFIRGKPIRFGFKNWCLNTPTGYLVDFEIYQGRSVQENAEYDKLFGKAASPLVKMIDELPPCVKALPTSFHHDNLFTSFQLLSELKRRGYHGTGTVRENRLPKDIPLTKKKEMLKEPRGTFVYTKSKEDNVIVVRWKDNSVVTAMSTLYGVEPLTNVTRFSASEQKKIQVPRPSVFTNYNRYMGGTDLMDQNVNTYRIGFRGKKWWWPIFTYLIDVTICNAWTLSRCAGSSISQLNFRRHIVQTYLMRFQTLPSTGGRPSASKFSKTGNRVADDIRFDGVGHLLVPTQGGSRRKCALESCNSQTRAQCRKCGVGLCLSCNLQYHT